MKFLRFFNNFNKHTIRIIDLNNNGYYDNIKIELEWLLLSEDDPFNYTEEEKLKYFRNDIITKLEKIVVHPEYRNNGYAYEIMEAVINYCTDKKYTEIYLVAAPIGFEPRIKLEDLKEFYTKFGFETIKYDHESYDMVKHL